MLEISPRRRLPMLLVGMASLVIGVLAGLARLGVDIPTFAQHQAGNHGALMIAAFFGTVISLERAVALRRLWPYFAPLFAGCGALALLIESPKELAPLFFILASTILVSANGMIFLQQKALFTLTLLLGSIAWLGGNALWLGSSAISTAMPLWMIFLILTIAGERLELTRFLPPNPLGQLLFSGLLASIVLGGIFAAKPEIDLLRLLAGSFLGLALWLFRYDIVRKTVRQSGLTRFIAIALLSGYAWLLIGGLLGLHGAFMAGHIWRDAALHSIFLGFVFSMVIGHAPIIFPAVMRVRIAYHPVFYLPLALLHLTLLARLLCDLAGNLPLRQLSAIGNSIAMGLFILTMLGSVIRGNAAKWNDRA